MLKVLSISTLSASALLWIFPIVNNDNLFPESRVCFRPEQILNEENSHLLRCDSNERVGILLTSILKDKAKKDVEFESKVASNGFTRHFDSNLNQAKSFLALSIVLSVSATVGFNKLKNTAISNRNKAYQDRRKEFVSNEMETDAYLYPISPQKQAIDTQLMLKQLQLQVSDYDKQISSNDLDVAKNNQEIKKIISKSGGDKTSSTITPDLDKLKASMIDALKSHEDGWLWKIIDNQTPLWLIGRQGSAKTWTACTIGLIRMYCLGIPVRHLIDEHAKGVNKDIWKLLSPKKITSDLDDMPEVFEYIIQNWKLRIEGKNELEEIADIDDEQIIIDEYTSLKNDVGVSAENFYRRSLKDTRKAKSWVIGVTHNDTNSAYPDGTKEQREAGTILIQKFSANGKAPLPRVKIIRGLFDDDGNELNEFEGSIPTWFNPQSIHGHFNGSPIEF
jgi:hypothetical protein